MLPNLAHGWETDQLSGRSLPLADVTAPADAEVDRLLDLAAHTVNDQFGCTGDSAKQRERVVRTLWKVSAARTPIAVYNLMRRAGHGAYAAWLESSELPRRSFHYRGDVFGGMQVLRGPILAIGGVSSTFQLAGVRMGTDKPDHFFALGYSYYRRALKRGEAAAVAYGTRTENTIYGWQSSAAFSFADLHANYQGYRFFTELWGGSDPYFQFDASGCVERRRDFHWLDWADWRWDEVNNPSVYRRAVQDWIEGRMGEVSDLLCVGADHWLAEAERLRSTAASEQAAYVGETAPAHVDTFRLAEHCAPYLYGGR